MRAKKRAVREAKAKALKSKSTLNKHFSKTQTYTAKFILGTQAREAKDTREKEKRKTLFQEACRSDQLSSEVSSSEEGRNGRE